MRIRIQKDGVCGEVPVRAGEYWVALRQDSKQIALIAGGRDLLIPATRRKATSRTKTTTIQYFTGGGTVWSLLVLDPKYGEWVAFIDFNLNKQKR